MVLCPCTLHCHHPQCCRLYRKVHFHFVMSHAGANPSESKNRYSPKPLSLTYIYPNFMWNAYLVDIWRIYAYRLRILYFKNVKISENYKKTSKFYHKTVFYTVHSQNLFKNTENFISGFFPDFPDPVIFQKKMVGKVGVGQLFHQNVAYTYKLNILWKLIWWQKVAGMKNAKN